MKSNDYDNSGTFTLYVKHNQRCVDFALGYWNIYSRTFCGSFGEYMYFNSELSTTDREKIEGNIVRKYNQTAILPANHPYKTVAPP